MLKPETAMQLYWWVLQLHAMSNEGAKIVDPKNHLGDAEEGATNNKGKGSLICEDWPVATGDEAKVYL